MRRLAQDATERHSMIALALFAMRTGGAALALADREHLLVRAGRWYALERDRTRWRAIARDPAAPVEAPTLGHLATAASRALLARGAPWCIVGRYERPERGDLFDVRFERAEEAGGRLVAISVLEVRRLVAATPPEHSVADWTLVTSGST